jgi:hypothetical protein
MSGFKDRAKALLAKIEASYGTDPTPTGAANAMMAYQWQLTPLAAQPITRNIELPYFGPTGEILTRTHMEARFRTEIAGGGTPLGTPPAYNVMLRSAGFAETITADTKVEYSPVTNGQESATLWGYYSNNLHKGGGLRSDWTCGLNANEMPYFEWNTHGLFVTPVGNSAPPALTLSAWKTPIPPSKVNTPTATLGGFALIYDQLTINGGNQLEDRFLVGMEEIVIADRAVRATLRIESPDIQTKDFFGPAIVKTRQALQVIHGTADGNKFQIDAPKVEISSVAYNNSQGVAMLNVGLLFVPDAGNDEIKFTFI